MCHREVEAPIPSWYQQEGAEQPTRQDILSPTPEGAVDQGTAMSRPPLVGLDFEPIPLEEADNFVDCDGIPRSSSDCEEGTPLNGLLAKTENASDDVLPEHRTDDPALSAVGFAATSNSPARVDIRLESVSVPLYSEKIFEATPQSRDVAGQFRRQRSTSSEDPGKKQPTDSRAMSAAHAVSLEQEDSPVDKLAAKHDEIEKSVEDIMEARRAARNKSWHAWNRRKAAQRNKQKSV